jgi:hypothetical protein
MPTLGGPMPEVDRKQMFSTAVYAGRSRLATGVATKRTPSSGSR